MLFLLRRVGEWRFALVLALLSLLAGGTSRHAGGQGPSSTASPTDAELAAKRREIADHVRVAQRKASDSASAAGEPAKSGDPSPEVPLLKDLDIILAQQQSARATEKEAQARKSDLQERLNAFHRDGPAEEPPYSFLLLDQLRDELSAQQARAETVAAAVATAQDAVSAAQAVLNARQQSVRRAKEAADTAKQPRAPERQAAVKTAELQRRLAQETLALRQLELGNEQLAAGAHGVRIALLEARLERIARDAAFTDSDLEDQLVEIEKQAAGLKRSLESAQANLDYAERQWFQARQQLDAATAPPAALEEEVEAKRRVRQWRQRQVAVLNANLQRLVSAREAWGRRFKVVSGAASPQEIIDWTDESESLLKQLDREKRLQIARIDELRQDAGALDKERQSAPGGAERVRYWISEQLAALQRLIQVYDANVVSIEAGRRLHLKLLGELQIDVNAWSFADKLASVWHYVTAMWNIELIRVDDNPITVGKVIVGILLLFLGFKLSRMLSGAFGRQLSRRFKINESGAAALQSVSFYLLVIVFTFTALRFANVPLTIFTFLGGAVAIGVGFGSQNVISNFISGLILLAERPVKVGDLIRLEDLYGTVEHVGPRSTRIRTGENLEILVPNSKFLENNVVNLTLGDDRLRTCVKVGVAYGSPTRDVARLLKHAADEHGLVLDKPEPFVWFRDFGDNALLFELHIWIRMRTMSDRFRIESDVRFKIDHLFRDAGIVIAFPQRDIHFDAERPLSVQVLPAERDVEFAEAGGDGEGL